MQRRNDGTNRIPSPWNTNIPPLYVPRPLTRDSIVEATSAGEQLSKSLLNRT